MRSRWFHRPLVHAAGRHKPVTWLELFYDLIFVAAFVQLADGLLEHFDRDGVFVAAATFVPLWLVWTGFSVFANRFLLDDALHRLSVLLQMFAIGGMALAAPQVLEGELTHFALATALAFGVTALMHARVAMQNHQARGYALYWMFAHAQAAGLWLAAGLLETHFAPLLAAIGTALLLLAPAHPRARVLSDRFPIDVTHLAERFGLLTLIVLGESFVDVVNGFYAHEVQPETYVSAAQLLLVTCGLWWMYFDDVAGAKIRNGRAGFAIWFYAHPPLQAAVLATGVSTERAVAFTWEAPAAGLERWMLAGSVALVFFAVAVIDSVTERKQAELSDRARINARWISGVLALVLAPAGAGMSGSLFLTLISGLVIVQVLVDIAVAPEVVDDEAQESMGVRPLAEVDADTTTPTRRRDITEAVRKGTPAALRRDLYFYFMEGSWGRIFGAFLIVFLLSNLFFACLYLLEPGAISGTETSSSFGDAFFFSVQTMSTIGYGAMSPGSTYGDAVVTAEAAVSIVGIAVVTGLVFAKASRPHASVLFSKVLTVSPHDGVPTLAFRVGNARGNEVVDASVTLTLVKSIVTAEGKHLRKLIDITPVRQRTPVFVLSWQIMHTLDEASPFADVDWDEPGAEVLAIVVTLTGHDGTYGQTIYARHVYYPEDLRVGHHFVDVISQLDDGRLLVDYGLFHDTVPVGTAPPAAPDDPDVADDDDHEAGAAIAPE